MPRPTELNDLGSNAGLGAWIPVAERLPEKDEWVQVFDADRQRVTPAKLLLIDREGYPDWYLCFIGGGPLRHVRSGTHWRPMAEAPNA
ncbi:MAG: DUF551 domain-containing protein [Patescibacteria group bacterium]|nr:DUF551 domain-containing protein [Patescibacteria group bacterium]